jgi:hypothetical protein
VRRVGVVTGDLQCVVNLDRAADIELTAVIQGPSAVRALACPQVHGDACFERRIGLA